MRKYFKRLLVGAAVVAALLQLTNPARTNPPVLPGRDLAASNAPPAEVLTLLRNACYDCHSAETRWPWYSRVAPVSWLVVGDINDARRRLNFSEWPHDDPRRAARKLRSMADEVSSGDMPLRSYTSMHAESRLTAAQREQLADWATKAADRLQPDAPEKGPRE